MIKNKISKKENSFSKMILNTNSLNYSIKKEKLAKQIKKKISISVCVCVLKKMSYLQRETNKTKDKNGTRRQKVTIPISWEIEFKLKDMLNHLFISGIQLTWTWASYSF